MTQKQQILNHLLSGKTLTPIQALTKYNSLRLAAVVFELKRKGYKVRTELINVGNKKQPKFVSKYSLIKSKKWNKKNGVLAVGKSRPLKEK